MSLKSMTGYGKGEARQDDVTITVEIKTVNHRYADISIKLPRSFLSLENGMRKQIGQALGRGKVDVYVNYELSTAAQAVPTLNRELASAYYQLFSSLARDLNLQEQVTISQILDQRDVIMVAEEDIDEGTLGSCLECATAVALEQLVCMRLAEGEETRKDLHDRLNAAEKMLEQIEKRAPQVPLEWQVKLTERLAKLQQNVDLDPQRVAQEIAVFADRCDISEELSRFKSHLVQFRALFNDAEPVGRRMDFLVQELNREVNTMGSKSNDAELTNSVVALKSELEKVREQVQNIE
jgi:uncharacterized protein (TIGR00255 family)